MGIDFSKLITAEHKFNKAQSAKTDEIDRIRDEKLARGFEYNGNVYDSDPKSIQRISAIATLTLLDPDFTTPYITRDNRTVTLAGSDIAGLGVAAAQHEAEHVFKARELKDRVLAATTYEELDAIEWED